MSDGDILIVPVDPEKAEEFARSIRDAGGGEPADDWIGPYLLTIRMTLDDLVDQLRFRGCKIKIEISETESGRTLATMEGGDLGSKKGGEHGETRAAP